jgi:hypothetical protein
LIVNAYYSALLLKNAPGIEISQEVRDQTLQEIFDLYGVIDGEFQETQTGP